MKSEDRSWWGMLLPVGFFLVLAVGAFALLNRKDEELGLRQEAVYDDFGFSVLSSEKKPDGYWVQLKVANHAKRVDFEFRPWTVLLSSEDGEKRIAFAEMRQPNPEACGIKLPAGTSCEFDLFYPTKVPVKDPHLVFSFGGSFFELLDYVFLGRKRIKLGPA